MDKSKMNQVLAEYLGDDGYEPVDPGGHRWRFECRYANDDFYRCGQCGVSLQEDDFGRTYYEKSDGHAPRSLGDHEPPCTVPFNEKLANVPDKNRPKNIVDDKDLLATVLTRVVEDFQSYPSLPWRSRHR